MNVFCLLLLWNFAYSNNFMWLGKLLWWKLKNHIAFDKFQQRPMNPNTFHRIQQHHKLDWTACEIGHAFKYNQNRRPQAKHQQLPHIQQLIAKWIHWFHVGKSVHQQQLVSHFVCELSFFERKILLDTIYHFLNLVSFDFCFFVLFGCVTMFDW